MPARYCCPFCPKNHDRHFPSHLRHHFERIHHLDLPYRPIGAKVAPSPTDNQDLGCCSCTQTFPTLDVFRNHLVVDYGIVPPDAPNVQWTSQHYQKTYPLEVKPLMSYVTESDTADLPPSATEATTTSSTSADAPISLAQSARPMPPTPLVNHLQPEPRQNHGAVFLMIVGAILAPIFRYFRRQ